MREWNGEKQIPGIVFDFQMGRRGIRIAPTRNKLFYKQIGEAAGRFFVRQMRPPYIGVLVVFPSNGELIYRHDHKLRDPRPNAL